MQRGSCRRRHKHGPSVDNTMLYLTSHRFICSSLSFSTSWSFGSCVTSSCTGGARAPLPVARHQHIRRRQLRLLPLLVACLRRGVARNPTCRRIRRLRGRTTTLNRKTTHRRQHRQPRGPAARPCRLSRPRSGRHRGHATEVFPPTTAPPVTTT